MKKFVKLNVKNEFNEINCEGVNPVTTVNAELWDWRYRYSPTGAREQKRLYYSPHGDSCDNAHPWVYYLLGAGGEQFAVYHGIQTSQDSPFGTGRRALMYASQFITNGGEYYHNLAIVIAHEIHHRYDALNCKPYTEKRSRNFMYWVFERQYGLRVSGSYFEYPWRGKP